MSKLKGKQKLQSDADTLDPTASCKKIVEHLELKNKNCFRFYNKCTGKRTEKTSGVHFNLVGHPVNTFPDDWDGELNHYEYFGRLHYKSTGPKYITTSIENIGADDPVIEFLKTKKDWCTNVGHLYSRSLAGNKAQQCEQINSDVVYCQKTVVNILKLEANDPDPTFNSTYNWYYSGHGNLHLIKINNIDYLLHCVFNILYLNQFDQSELRILPDNAVTYDCGEDNNIFEIISEDNFIVLRCRRRIFILKIIDTGENITIEKIKNVYSEVSYTSVNFDNFHKNILYISKIDNNLIIVNMDRMTVKNVKLREPSSMVDNWNTVMFVDRFYYCHISTRGVEIYDKRTHTSAGLWLNLTRNLDFNCNKITAAQKFNDCLYVGTTHHLITLDIRYKKKFNPVILQRWTHNMKSPPTYIFKCPYEISKDLVCMSSQWCEDVRIFVSESDDIMRGQKVSSAVVPYSPPNILHVLNEAKLQMYCQDIYNQVDDRVSSCITGLSLLEDGEKYIILIQNSLGDISRNILYPEHMEMFVEDDSVESLHEWSKGYKEIPRKFEVTLVKNIFGKLMQLKDVSDVSSPFDATETEKSVEEDISHIKEEIIKTFTSNTVESGLLEAWDLRDTGLVIEK